MKKLITILISLVIPLFIGAKDFTLNRGYVDANSFYLRLPIETKANLVILDVQVDGKKKKFLLDTGAPTVISRSLQKQLKCKALSKVNVTDINEAEGALPAVNVPYLQIGHLQVRDVAALVVEDNNPIFQYLGIDGIIGSNMLRNMILRISAREKVIVLTDNLSLLDTYSAYKINMHTDKDMQSSPVITVKLGDGITEELLFDTGFDGFYNISAKKFAMFNGHNDVDVLAVEKANTIVGMIGIDTLSDKYKVLIPRYNIAGFVFHNVIAYTSSDNNSKLGAQFLSVGDVTLDYINNEFYLQPYPMTGNADGTCINSDIFYCKD